MKNTISLALLTATVFLLGCASSSVLIGKARAPIAPASVKLYLTPPAQFEEVALLEASSKSSFAITDQGKMNKVIERLKEEAAKLGANGILIRTTGDASGPVVGSMVGSGSSAFFVANSAQFKNGTGVAIFVIKE